MLDKARKLIGPEAWNECIAVTFGEEITRLNEDTPGHNFVMLVTPKPLEYKIKEIR